jgi:hypothetical protein
MDVGGHLLKSFFTVAQSCLYLFPTGDIAQNGNVPPGQVVRLCHIFNADRLAIPSQNPCLAVFVLAVEEASPSILEISRAWAEFTYWLTYESAAVTAE